LDLNEQQKLSIQEKISLRLLHLILYDDGSSFKASDQLRRNSDQQMIDIDLKAYPSMTLYSELMMKANEKSSELFRLLHSLELLVERKQLTGLTAEQLDHELNKRFNDQNVFLMRKLFESVRVA
jgi:hypothetical protein